MQTLLIPAVRPGGLSPSMATATPRTLLHCLTHNPSRDRMCYGSGYHSSFILSLQSSLSHMAVPASYSTTFPSSLISSTMLNGEKRGLLLPPIASATASAAFPDETEQAKLTQVAKRLKITARYFKRWGSFGFWGQLICTLVAAVILSFSMITTGKITSPLTFYSTAAGIAAAFISVFWSFGYLRLSERLQRTANDPSKAPPRADVVKGLKNGIIVNLLGMGAAVLGMQATVGLLVAKALTSSATPYYQNISPGYSPVLALDIFLVQASANTILSHFLGLLSSLELLRSVTLPPAGPAPAPKIA